MVRTRAENTGRRAVAAKAPRKQFSGGCSSSSSVNTSPGAKEKHSGGNPVRWTATPPWQKGIDNFFSSCNSDSSSNENITSSDQGSTTSHDPSALDE